jgi:hypothetical protein
MAFLAANDFAALIEKDLNDLEKLLIIAILFISYI